MLALLRKKIEAGEIRVIDEVNTDYCAKWLTGDKYITEAIHNHNIKLKDIDTDSTLLIAVVQETERV